MKEKSNDINNSMIYGKNIVKNFKDFWGRVKVEAVKGIDIDVKKGDLFGLLGPNGAGKSTLIKIILGHLNVTSGQISVMNKDPKNREIKYKLGYLPEKSNLYRHLNAYETLNYFGKLLNLSKTQIKDRSEQLLEMLGLQKVADRLIGNFSHGMMRRMGLAQALLNDPDLLILDEPTAGLDPLGCREVKDVIQTLSKRGKTILMTSHLLNDMEDLCTKVMIMYGGKEQAKGDLETLLSNQNKQQLIFDKVSDDTIVKVQNILKEESKAVELSNPQESLEQYFLQTINNSSDSTSGAQKGTGVAKFLQDDILESLTNDRKPEIKEEEVVEEVLEEVLDNKVEKKADKVDNKVLDDLMK